jgi:hypothetical protein
MFKIYLTKTAQDQMTRDDLYLLTQTMRISNSLKVFVLVADDIRKYGPDDIVNQKKFVELLLYHAANLHEILDVLKKDLFPRYQVAIKESSLLAGLRDWEERIKAKDETIRVLEDIRNKHAFHVPHDEHYVWHTITDSPAKEDVVIGVGETIEGRGHFFTWDVDMLFAYLREHALVTGLSQEQSYDRVKNIIDNASQDLYKLFNNIIQYMLKNRILMVGDKSEAKREYGRSG